MSSRVDPSKSEEQQRPGEQGERRERAKATGRFDKAFPVFLEGERGVASGIGRNITDTGMFVETREPFPLGSRVKVSFSSPNGRAEMVLEGEVRYQCFINFTRADSTRAGMRGIGLRFVEPRGAVPGRKGTLH